MNLLGTRRGRLATLLTVATAAAIGVSGCSSSSKGGANKIAIVAYSVPKPAYDALESAFKQTAPGKSASFSESYGPSGTQSKAVSSGQPADYVAFSLQSDMTKLVPKFVAAGWNSGATKGMVSDSVVVIVVRKGNPKHINGWADLVKPGIKIVTPDPASSGSAKWNVLAAYSHVTADGGTDAAAQAYLKQFFQHVVSKPSSGANATTTFTQGTGDALISYENEAIAARQKGASVDYIVPTESILIENPAAVTLKAPAVAKDFLSFALSEPGQKIFASKGFRPVVANVAAGTVQGANDPANPFPTVAKLTTIADLGGWSKVNDTFFDAKKGIVTKIENEVG
ncbi:MAG: sulfate transporter, periplasmic sulfate-binding protein [Pseudonocardiales bacterium]|nr:sulfate transporter, periplasmic sulfate-binding protein [Pseudonocardiales bacterium]